jgi:hypothetical protein
MQSRNQGQALIFEAMAYALAGMFLLAGLVNKSTTLIVLGWVFMVYAASLIIASFFKKAVMKGWWVGVIHWIQTLLPILLFYVTFVEFISESVKPQKDIYIWLMFAFLLLLAVGIFVQTSRTIPQYFKNRVKK